MIDTFNTFNRQNEFLNDRVTLILMKIIFVRKRKQKFKIISVADYYTVEV